MLGKRLFIKSGLFI